MKIAQIAPLMESVPPRGYGGTERVVSYLTEALVADGHEVTLFASGCSLTGADLVACAPQALRLNASVRDPLPYYMIMLDRVRQMAGCFDVLHFHIDYLHFPVFRDMAPRTITTLHSRQDQGELKHLYAAFPELPLVAVSEAQRASIPGANVIGTVHHGIPSRLYEAETDPRGGYLAFVGRMSPEKRVDRAIAIARAAGMKLRIAAKVDRAEVGYFNDVLRPLIEQPDVEFVGEIDERRKGRFIGEARALLFPIDWPEPFGLVLIEAMACGTPVLAFGNGAVQELVEPGVTGAVVNTLDEAHVALNRVLRLDRRRVRQRFEERFTAERMAADYVALYERLAVAETSPLRAEPVDLVTRGGRPERPL